MKSQVIQLLASIACFIGSSAFVPKDLSGQEHNVAPSTYELPATDEGLPGAGPIRRYEWFRDLWNRKRATWSQSVDVDQGAVVFFGDSITQGWGEDFKGYFPELKKANRGISGDTTRGMLIRLEQDVLALNPKAVIMLMGTNDLEEGAEPETVVANIQLIVDRLEAADSSMPIVLCQIFPSSDQKKRPATKIKRVNELLQVLASREPRVTLLDTWTFFADANGDAKLEEFPDLLHPNDAGYKKWASALTPIMARHGLIETDPVSLPAEPSFVSLFNGKDLTGWGYRPTTEELKKTRDGWKNRPEWPIIEKSQPFDGLTSSPDGRFVAVHGKLIVTIPPAGRKIQQIYTQQEFTGDFVLRLEFRASPNADSGIYLRGPQLQCRDYRLAGPYKQLESYRPQDWNEIEIRVQGDKAECRCNGELFESNFQVPPSGPIGFEGDRGQVEYRNIRIKTMGN